MHVSASVDILPRHRGTYSRGGGGGGYVLSGHCSGQQISEKNEGYLFSEGYLFTGFYGSSLLGQKRHHPCGTFSNYVLYGLMTVWGAAVAYVVYTRYGMQLSEPLGGGDRRSQGVWHERRVLQSLRLSGLYQKGSSVLFLFRLSRSRTSFSLPGLQLSSEAARAAAVPGCWCFHHLDVHTSAWIPVDFFGALGCWCSSWPCFHVSRWVGENLCALVNDNTRVGRIECHAIGDHQTDLIKQPNLISDQPVDFSSARSFGIPRVHKNKSMQLHTMGSVTAEFEVRHRWGTTTLFSGRYALKRWTRACSLSPEALSFWLAFQARPALCMHVFVKVQCSTLGSTLEDKCFSFFSTDWRWQWWRTSNSAVTAFIAKRPRVAYSCSYVLLNILITD